MRSLLLLLCVVTAPALAQELPDAGLPDASVGGGGTDMNQEENDGNDATCLSDANCDNGFACVSSRCQPRPVQNLGCSVGGPMQLVALALVIARRRAALNSVCRSCTL